MTADDWAGYTDAAQQMSAIRGEEQARAGQLAAGTRDGKVHVDRLTRRLAAQRQHLTQLAVTLRLPAPQFGGIVRSGVPDPGEALRLAATAADAADTAARTAERRATRPPLLPDLTPLARNSLVYAAAAVLGTVASIAIFTISPGTRYGRIPLQLVPWSLCGLPALAFFAGYLTISLLGQPRIGGGGTRSVRLGGAICFVGMPILWFIFIAATRG